MTALTTAEPQKLAFLHRLAKLCPREIPYLSIGVSQVGLEGLAEHVDARNLSLSVMIAFGKYEGGLFVQAGKMMNPRRRWVRFMGQWPHEVTPVSNGVRTSVIFYVPTRLHQLTDVEWQLLADSGFPVSLVLRNAVPNYITGKAAVLKRVTFREPCVEEVVEFEVQGLMRPTREGRLITRAAAVVGGEDVVRKISANVSSVQEVETRRTRAKSKAAARKKRENQALKRLPQPEEVQLSKTTPIAVEAIRRAQGSQRQRWKRALEAELTSMKDNRVYIPIKHQEALEWKRKGAVSVPGRIVAGLKPDEIQELGFKEKARVVACGNFADQFEVFSVSNLDASVFRLVLVTVLRARFAIAVVDVRTAFLHADIEPGRVVLVEPPQTMRDYDLVPCDETWVLSKALYGLKESPGLWQEHRDKVLRELRCSVRGQEYQWIQSLVHGSVWFLVTSEEAERLKTQRRGETCDLDKLAAMACSTSPEVCDFPAPEKFIAIMTVYVDDLFVAGLPAMIEETLGCIRAKWKTSDPKVLGRDCSSLTYLGIVIQYSAEGFEGNQLLVHQVPYIADFLDKHSDLVSVRGRGTPGMAAVCEQQVSEEQEEVDIGLDDGQVSRMRAVLGSILWVATRTRPDLAWAHSVAAGLVAGSPRAAWKRMLDMIAYLQVTQEEVMVLAPSGCSGVELEAYTDISFAPQGQHSHAGATLFWDGCLVTWRSHRQSLVSTSTAEAELLAALDGLHMLRAARAVLREFGEHVRSARILCDNAAAVSIATGTPAMRTRHFSMRAWQLNEAIKSGELAMTYVSTQHQRADSLTKGMSVLQTQAHRRMVGMYPLEEAVLGATGKKGDEGTPEERSAGRTRRREGLSGSEEPAGVSN